MVFDGDADNQDICTLADDLSGTSDTSFPKAKKARFANWGCREILKIAWRAYGGWISDDTNNSGAPEFVQNLVTTARNIYACATAQMIDAMEWMDANGNWNRLIPITLEEIIAMGYAETEFMNTAGNPIYYRPVQNGVRLYPDSDAARSNALKAHIRRDISPFTSASTNTSPGFDSTLHEYVAVFMSWKFCDTKNIKSRLPSRLNDWLIAQKVIKDHYGEKFRQHFPQNLKRANNRFVEQYM